MNASIFDVLYPDYEGLRNEKKERSAALASMYAKIADNGESSLPFWQVYFERERLRDGEALWIS